MLDSMAKHITQAQKAAKKELVEVAKADKAAAKAAEANAKRVAVAERKALAEAKQLEIRQARAVKAQEKLAAVAAKALKARKGKLNTYQQDFTTPSPPYERPHPQPLIPSKQMLKASRPEIDTDSSAGTNTQSSNSPLQAPADSNTIELEETAEKDVSIIAENCRSERLAKMAG